MYIFNFINVVIETVILWVYCNSLFPEKKSMSNKKWLVYTFVAVFSTFTGALKLPVYANLTIAFLMCFVVALSVYDNPFKNKLFLAVIYIVVILMVDVIVSAIITVYGIEYNMTSSYDITYIVGAMLSNFVRFWICVYIGKFLGMRLRGLPVSYWIFFAVCPVLSILCLLVFDSYLMQAESVNLYTVFIPSFCILYVNFMLFRFFETFSEKIRLMVVEELAQSEKENYKLLQENEEELRSLRHDIKNHILMIEEYLNKSNTETAIEHIKGISKTLDAISTIIYTSNPSIDAAVNIGGRKARLAGIDYKVQVLGNAEVKVEAVDICRLLSNAIDNAIEAAQETKEKYIFMEIKISEENIIIHIENSTQKEKSSLLTSKKDRKNHGFGMIGIKKVVNKQNGVMNYNLNNGVFSLNIMLKNI